MPTENEKAAARLKLDQAIREYTDEADPGKFVESWVVLIDKTGLDTGDLPLAIVTGPGARWTNTRGMLDIALTRERQGQSPVKERDDY